MVPSSYKQPEGPQITIVASRITRKGCGQVSENIIILNGGPGTVGEQNRDVIEMIYSLFGDAGVACWELDLRGTGRSTPFVSVPIWNAVQPEKNQRVLEQLPFDYRDLTMENAAGDVAALAEAIQEKYGRSVLGAYGFSFGATLAYTTVALFPDVFDYAMMGGLDNRTIGEEPWLQQVLERCERSRFCRARFGGKGKVEETFRTMMPHVLNSEYNACTNEFCKLLDPGGSGGKAQLLRRMRNLVMGYTASEGWPREHPVHSSQVLLAFLKATYDCRLAKDYSQTLKVIEPLLDTETPTWELWKAYQSLQQQFAESNYTDQQIKELLLEHNLDPEEYKAAAHPERHHSLAVDFNETAYLLLGSNYRYDIYGNSCGNEQACQRYLLQAGEADPSPHWQDCLYYSTVNSHFLRNLLGDRPFFQIPPIAKTKTRIAIIASSMDTTTPPHRAYKSFRAITGSPWKTWMCFANYFHDGYMGPAFLELFQALRKGQPISKASLRLKMREERIANPLPWSFRGLEQFERIWEHTVVVPEADQAEAPPLTSSLPALEVSIQEGYQPSPAGGTKMAGLAALVNLARVVGGKLLPRIRRPRRDAK